LPTDPRTPIAYLVSQYPAANHTFVLREILEIRNLGREVRVASIRRPDRAIEKLSLEEQQEERTSFYVKSQGMRGFLAANLRILLRQPVRYVSAVLYAIRLARGPRSAAYNLAYLAEAAIVVNWLERHAIRRLHMHFTSTVGLFVERLTPVFASATMHGSDEFRDPAGFYLPEKISKFRLIVAISDYGLEQLHKCSTLDSRSKLHVVRLGVRPELYLPRPFRNSPECYQLLFVGRLEPVKNVPILLGALARLVSEGRRVRLTLIGDGTERASLESEVAHLGVNRQVCFLGRQTPEQVRSSYQGTDVFCLPSLMEGIPVVLMEAMAMAIPCIATPVGGVRELIRDQVDGLLVSPSNEDELVVALRRLLDDSDLRRSLGTAGRERVSKDYNLQRNVKQLAALLDAAVEQQSEKSF